MSPLLVHGIEWIITAILAGAVGWFGNALRKKQAHDDAMEQGMRVLLRTQIVDAYDLYHNQHARLTVERKREIVEAYGAYSALGGDGVITEMYRELEDIDIWIERGER